MSIYFISPLVTIAVEISLDSFLLIHKGDFVGFLFPTKSKCPLLLFLGSAVQIMTVRCQRLQMSTDPLILTVVVNWSIST